MRILPVGAIGPISDLATPPRATQHNSLGAPEPAHDGPSTRAFWGLRPQSPHTTAGDSRADLGIDHGLPRERDQWPAAELMDPRSVRPAVTTGRRSSGGTP